MKPNDIVVSLLHVEEEIFVGCTGDAVEGHWKSVASPNATSKYRSFQYSSMDAAPVFPLL